MKTINLELSKRLAPYLEGIETEYVYKLKNAPENENDKYYLWTDSKPFKEGEIKTLTLEEAIKFLSKNANEKGRYEMNAILLGGLWDNFSVLEIFNIKIAEKMIDYLLTNNLLEQGQN